MYQIWFQMKHDNHAVPEYWDEVENECDAKAVVEDLEAGHPAWIVWYEYY